MSNGLTIKPIKVKSANEAIARICHEVNRAYCVALGDMTQLSWEIAPQWQKDSAMAGVDLLLANPDLGPSATHDAWMAQKIKDGWVYGAFKDPENRRHPCLVPFEQLGVEQQAKDHIFRAIVVAIAQEQAS